MSDGPYQGSEVYQSRREKSMERPWQRSDDEQEEKEEMTDKVEIPLESREQAVAIKRAKRTNELIDHANKVIINIFRRGLCRGHYAEVVRPSVTSLRVFRQGNFVAVLLNNDIIGISKRNKMEKFRWNEGVRKAIYRAAKKLVEVQQRRR